MAKGPLQFLTSFFKFVQKTDLKYFKKMVLGMLFENFKKFHILRYVIYEFLKKVLGGPRPTCLVRVHCAGAGVPRFLTCN